MATRVMPVSVVDPYPAAKVAALRWCRTGGRKDCAYWLNRCPLIAVK